MTRYIFLLYILLTFQLTSQNDTLNRNDLHGKKDGYWLQYLDSNANPTNKQNYKYLGFEYYENGKVLFRFKKSHWKNKAFLTVEKGTCCSN